MAKKRQTRKQKIKKAHHKSKSTSSLHIAENQIREAHKSINKPKRELANRQDILNVPEHFIISDLRKTVFLTIIIVTLITLLYLNQNLIMSWFIK